MTPSKNSPHHAGLPGYTAKREGEIAELAFIHEAARHGFGVAKPYGDSFRYDFILDSGETFWRVQVKSTHTSTRDRSHVRAHCHHYGVLSPYSVNEFDFLVAYLVPVNAWYVVHASAFVTRESLRFYPGKKRGRYEQYRGAWCLMACRREGEFQNTRIVRPCELSPSNFPHAAPAQGCPRRAEAASRPLPPKE